MIDLLQIGDACRTWHGRPARHVGCGLALFVFGGRLATAPAAPARGGEALHPLPTDAEVVQAAIRVSW